MKRNLLVCLLGGVGAVAATAQPVAWWKFDETSGTTANATIGSINGALVGGSGFVAGKSGNAVSVSQAGGGLVTFGNNFDFPATNFSYSFWLKTSTTAADQVVIGKHTATVVAGYFTGVNQNTPYGAANKAWAYQSNVPGNEPISSTSVNDDVWHHIAVTYQTGQHRLYVDGNLEATKTGTPNVSTTAEFMIGAYSTVSGGRTASFTGLVDDLQIYDSTLADTDVRFLSQNAGQAVPEPATLAIVAGAGLAWMRRRRA